jgi:hypothetical protein
LQFGELEDDRTRIERVERQQVDGALGAGADRIAAAVGHDAVADFEQHFERAVGRILGGEPGRGAGDLHGALEPAAQLEEAPAGKTIHVFMHETGKAASLRNSTVMALVASSPGRTLLAKRCAVFCRSTKASQPSGEKRSRIWLALCTALSMDESRPSGMASAASTSMVSRKAAQWVRIGRSVLESSARRAL